MISATKSLSVRLRQNVSGVAAVEFALTAPIVLTMFLSGAELTNYAVTKMRVSQLVLHVADNGSRIGTDTALAVKQISEAQINDLLIGANLQAGSLDLLHQGRVILSSLEAMPAPDEAKFKVHWQRCFGQKVYSSAYGDQGATNLTSFGPLTKQITSVPVGSAIMYVEISYTYKPLISSRLVPSTEFRDTAAMMVRDQRDFTGGVAASGVYNNENVVASTCPA